MGRASKLIGPVLLLSTVAIGLAVTELVFRAYLRHRYGHLVASAARSSWLLLPDDPKVYGLRHSYDGGAPFQLDTSKSFKFHTNHDGYREREIGPRREGVRRAVVIGDSYAFGWAVAVEDAFPRRLEELLNGAGIPAEVLNLGVPGYGTTAELEVVREALPKYRPDLVIMTYVMNDAEPQGTVQWPPDKTYGGCGLWLWEDLKQAANASALAKLGELPLCKRVMDFDYLKGFEPSSYKWRESRAALGEITALCRRASVPLILVVLPDFSRDLDGTYPFRPIHQSVAGWGRELDIPTVDLLPVFIEEHPTTLQYRVDGDGHPNAAAHRRIAELILPEVRKALPSPAR
jgi:lysophospholipase L1-like esterase